MRTDRSLVCGLPSALTGLSAHLPRCCASQFPDCSKVQHSDQYLGIPHPLLSQQAFSRFVQDYLVFGNAYLEKTHEPIR